MTREEARANVGKTVEYTPPGQNRPADIGEITNVTDSYVFVRFFGDNHSKATAAAFLRLAGEST